MGRCKGLEDDITSGLQEQQGKRWERGVGIGCHCSLLTRRLPRIEEAMPEAQLPSTGSCGVGDGWILKAEPSVELPRASAGAALGQEGLVLAGYAVETGT